MTLQAKFEPLGNVSLLVIDVWAMPPWPRKFNQIVTHPPNVTIGGGYGIAQFGGLYGSSVAIGKKGYFINGDLFNSTW
jgi:hypothetical protein